MIHADRPNTQTINIKTHDPLCAPIQSESGDWIDLSTAHEYTLKSGDFALIDLGVSMSLPSEHEAHLIVRSSTFKKYGIIQTNGMGIIDNSYSGDDDIWKLPVYATRDITIPAHVRIAQFRTVPVQPFTHFFLVPTLNNPSRGGFGSTGD